MRRLLLLTLLIPGLSSAQELTEEDELLPEQVEREVRYKKQTNIDFEGVDVTAELVGPGVITVWEPAEGKGFPPLFKLRANWDQEMHESLDEVK